MAKTSALETIDTPRVPVSSTYHGITVTEDYRWLEDGASNRTRSWTIAQDQHARNYLQSLPFYDAVRLRVEEVLRTESVTYGALRRAGSAYFVLKDQPPKQQPFLVVLSGLDDLPGERVLVDPNEIDDSGSTRIDWYQPAPDGSLVAVSLSSRGTEDGTVHIYETASGRLKGASVPRVTGGTASGSLAWAGDSSGFWYSRYPSPGERAEEDREFFQEVWYHPLGDPLADRRELSSVFADDRIAENFLNASPDGLWVMDRVQRGDGGEWQVFVRAQAGGDWWLAADVDDKVIYATFGPGALYLLSRLDAPRGKVLRLPLRAGTTVARATEVVAEAAVTIEGPAGTSNAEGGLAVTDNRLWVLDNDGGRSSLRLFHLDGTPAGPVEVPPNSSVNGQRRLDGHEVAYTTESFTEPRSWWCASEQAARRIAALATKTSLSFRGIEVRREFATSPDGTRVPVTLIAPEGTPRDGTTPALLTGYGGYGISLKPWFDPSWLPWLEQGGVLAVAHIRGGGEYGEGWHHAGRLTAKQNVFDDFAACARFLVESRVTTSERLAIMGGSNGGLLMGAMLTQHPGLSRAVVAMVPVMDVLRTELHPNGAFNVTEFGTVKDLEQFRAMHAYSPYHNVADGAAYPAVLLTAGEFDPRVDAYHAKKMAARLQAATCSGQPVLLRVEAGGHGAGNSLDQRASEVADVYAFLFDRLGIGYRAPACRTRG
ncbi:MAG TPA: prolyl oligopeptidase family serine peptidase [Streptosporangiaceae bacterium]|jgi:prolyl oligopeptidase